MLRTKNENFYQTETRKRLVRLPSAIIKMWWVWKILHNLVVKSLFTGGKNDTKQTILITFYAKHINWIYCFGRVFMQIIISNWYFYLRFNLFWEDPLNFVGCWLNAKKDGKCNGGNINFTYFVLAQFKVLHLFILFFSIIVAHYLCAVSNSFIFR